MKVLFSFFLVTFLINRKFFYFFICSFIMIETHICKIICINHTRKLFKSFYYYKRITLVQNKIISIQHVIDVNKNITHKLCRFYFIVWNEIFILILQTYNANRLPEDIMQRRCLYFSYKLCKTNGTKFAWNN
jgi:hypothetical protein